MRREGGRDATPMLWPNIAKLHACATDQAETLKRSFFGRKAFAWWDFRTAQAARVTL